MITQLFDKKHNKKYVAPGFPIGTIYMNVNNINPEKFFGGTWERFGQGKMIVGVDESDLDFNTSQKTGGEKTHQLIQEELPNVSTTIWRGPGDQTWGGFTGVSKVDGVSQGVVNTTQGKNKPHNNLQPYITVYMWKKIL